MRWTQRLTFQWMLGALFAGGVMAMQATPVSAAEIRATVSFSASDYEAKQSGGMLKIPVIRSNVRTAKASVNYFTTDGSARAGIDYTAKSGALYWRRGDSSAKTIEIPIRTVAAYSGSRTFTVHLTSPEGAADLGIPSLAKVTIVPDTSVPDVDPQPYIDSFSPASGPVGTVVTVIGSGFTGVNAAWVGTSHNAPVSVLSDTSVAVTIPSDASTGAIGIFNPSHVSFTATSFTVTSGPSDPGYPQPYIQSFSPTSGGVGTIVTINGSGFTGLNAAWVGAAHNASVAVLSDTQVKVTVPEGATSGAIGIFNPAHVAFTASPFTVTSSPPPPPPPGNGALSLRTQGNRFIDGNGNYIQLRGVNYSGFEFAAIQGWSGNDPSGGQAGQPGGPNWAALKAWKVNILRIPLNEASWLGGSCVDTSGNVINPDPAGNYRS
ncbi:MAG TPA: IPT/TIG domain-containing protein, partial [Arenimonas sp.]|nr:IPT/TIG domain-containing protein [Arenimonas sp.]